ARGGGPGAERLGRKGPGARGGHDETNAAGEGGHAREEQPGIVALGGEPQRVGAGRLYRSRVGQIVPGVLELPGEPHSDLQHEDTCDRGLSTLYICAPKTTTIRRASPPTRVRTPANMAGPR